MKKNTIFILAATGLILLLSCPGAVAQSPNVIPQRGQSLDQQRQDESECDSLAKQPSHDGSEAAAPDRRDSRGRQGGAAIWAFGGRGAGAAAGAAAGAQTAREESRKEEARERSIRQQEDDSLRANAACLRDRGYLVQ